MFSQLSSNIHLLPASVRLSDIISDVPVVQLTGPWDTALRGITTDSRLVEQRWMFVATEGEHTDGHRYVQQAVERGAACVVVQRAQYEGGLAGLLTASFAQHNATTVVVVENTREAVALLADRYYGSPARSLRLIGITGTNGKTTTCALVTSVLQAAGERVGMIGTIEYHIHRRVVPATYTTPPAEDLHRLFAEMRDARCTSVVMEVSSHALALQRVHGLRYAASVFTNLTQDHLDFHRTMDAYADAKALLFRDHTAHWGILNADDSYTARMGEHLGRKKRTYGRAPRSTFRITRVDATTAGTRVDLRHRGEDIVLRSPLVGSFNAHNLAAAYAVCFQLGVPSGDIRRGLRNLRAVPGRFERIRSADGVVAVVDYSHTPDALAHAIENARGILGGRGRVITVFGCGGDRDRGKRPMMGAVASHLSDAVIVTSDNPRTEDPDAIIAEILNGASGPAEVRHDADRRKAIRHALRLAAPGDVVLVAGKGHETYQITGTARRHFDDREIIRAYFERSRGGAV